MTRRAVGEIELEVLQLISQSVPSLALQRWLRQHCW